MQNKYEQTQGTKPKNNKRTRKNRTNRRNSTITFSNCQEWNEEDMEKYKQDILFQIRELMITSEKVDL